MTAGVLERAREGDGKRNEKTQREGFGVTADRKRKENSGEGKLEGLARAGE